MSVAGEILAIYATHGAGAYFGERVSMTEHALQSAYFAQQGGAPALLVLAALLHDIGHLLAQRFPAAICEPVRLHVAAKRYLCATDAQYSAKLSPASVHTLKLQGGPMSANEVAQFESERYFTDAVRVRRWDDAGKVAGLKTPQLAEYGTRIAGSVQLAR